jgi:hypothetical protein
VSTVAARARVVLGYAMQAGKLRWTMTVAARRRANRGVGRPVRLVTASAARGGAAVGGSSFTGVAALTVLLGRAAVRFMTRGAALMPRRRAVLLPSVARCTPLRDRAAVRLVTIEASRVSRVCLRHSLGVTGAALGALILRMMRQTAVTPRTARVSR